MGDFLISVAGDARLSYFFIESPFKSDFVLCWWFCLGFGFGLGVLFVNTEFQFVAQAGMKPVLFEFYITGNILSHKVYL